MQSINQYNIYNPFSNDIPLWSTNKTIIKKKSWPTTFSQVFMFSWARLYSAQILSNSVKEAGVVKHPSSNTCIASERSFPKRTLMLTCLFKNKSKKEKIKKFIGWYERKFHLNNNGLKLQHTTLSMKRYLLKPYIKS